MDGGMIRRARDQAVEGIHLPHQMSFAESADRRIAGHGADRFAREADQSDGRAHARGGCRGLRAGVRSEEHTSELQSLMRISYAVFCLKKKIKRYILQENNEPYIKTNNNHQK